MRSKVVAIQNAPQPQDKSQLRSFIGLVNYYGRFFPNLSTVLYPLNLLLHNESEFCWDTDCQTSFDAVKNRLNSSDFLTHFDPKLPLILATDASPYRVGAVISHSYPDGTERPIQFKNIHRLIRRHMELYSAFENSTNIYMVDVSYFM